MEEDVSKLEEERGHEDTVEVRGERERKSERENGREGEGEKEREKGER